MATTDDETRTGECRGCGQAFTYTVATIGTREIAGPMVCDRCVEREDEAERRRLEAETFRRRVTRAGIPPSRSGVPMAHLAPGIAKIAKSWADGETAGLVLTGPVGVGKTHVAAAAAWARLRRTGVRWVRCAPLMTALGGSFDDDARRNAIALATGTGDVILDDIDKVRATDYGREVLYTLVDNRIEYGSALLVTSNATLGEIGEKIGEEIASRLAGYCRSVSLTGPDRRITS